MSAADATVGTQELPLSLHSQLDRFSRLTLVALGAGALAAAGFAVGAAGAAGVAGVPLGSTGVSDKPEPVAGAAGASEAAGESVAGESEAPALLQAHTLSVQHAQGHKGVPTGVSESPEPMVGAIGAFKGAGKSRQGNQRSRPCRGHMC